MPTAMRELDQFEPIAGRRRAVRAFLPRPVDRALIERALTIAATAPSSCNPQPWTLHIASGTALVRLCTALTEAVSSGLPPSYEVAADARSESTFPQRRINATSLIYADTGRERIHTASRAESLHRHSHFFCL